MMTRDGLISASAAIRALLASGPEAALRAIPGVLHVSVGLKERAGRALRDVLCIRVYVQAKRPDDELAPAERIPREIGGVPTDVNVVGRYAFAMDTTRYRPVKGGISITNHIIALMPDGSDTGMESGTLGCIATRTSDKSAVALGNWHVMMANGAIKKRDKIYQPAPLTWDPVPIADAPQRPRNDDDIIGTIVDFKITDKVDCAIAKLDESSCCHCCGIEHRNEIVGLSENGTPPSNTLLGMRDAVEGHTVYKVGMRTGRTEGVVMDLDSPEFTIPINGVDHTFRGQILINGSDIFGFSAPGDSGAAIVDEDGFIVGLLFANNDLPFAGDRTAANHIQDVCSALGITINLDRSTHHSAGERIAVPTAPFAGELQGREAYAAAHARLTTDPAGAWLLGMTEEHREEIVHLVTGHRPVTVAWHRAGGPAFFAAGVNTLRAGGDALPSLADGTPLDLALARVGDALVAHGSPALRAAIEAHRVAILDAVRGSMTLGEVLDKLRPNVVAPVDPP
jgi:hypothetical protein